MRAPRDVIVVGAPGWLADLGATVAAAAGANDDGSAAPALRRVDTLADVASWLEAAGEAADSVVVVDLATAPDAAAELAVDLGLSVRVPIVVVAPDAATSAAADAADAWLRDGAEDVLDADELVGPGGWRRLRHAAIRHRRSAARATAWATDPATGLPHRRQLIEHLSQLLALRQRDPSPMAVLALRLELPRGEDADRVWRKAAVRLRAAVRSSDVVAAADEALCVVLGTLLDAGDAEAVAAKLVEALARPYPVGTGEVRVGVATGIAAYPQDGNEAQRLVRRALALAAVAPTRGGADAAPRRPGEAANDG